MVPSCKRRSELSHIECRNSKTATLPSPAPSAPAQVKQRVKRETANNGNAPVRESPPRARPRTCCDSVGFYRARVMPKHIPRAEVGLVRLKARDPVITVLRFLSSSSSCQKPLGKRPGNTRRQHTSHARHLYSPPPTSISTWTKSGRGTPPPRPSTLGGTGVAETREGTEPPSSQVATSIICTALMRDHARRRARTAYLALTFATRHTTIAVRHCRA